MTDRDKIRLVTDLSEVIAVLDHARDQVIDGNLVLARQAVADSQLRCCDIWNTLNKVTTTPHPSPALPDAAGK